MLPSIRSGFSDQNRILQNHLINTTSQTSGHYISDLVSFPNNIFATTYLESNNARILVEKFRNGQIVPGYTTAEISHDGGEPGRIDHLQACSYNEQILVLYNYYFTNATSYTYILYGRLVNSDGTFRTSQFVIPGGESHNGTLSSCTQIDTNLILIDYSLKNSSWDVYFLTYNPETNTFTNSSIINTDNISNKQAYSYPLKLQGTGQNEYIIAFTGDSPNMIGEGIHIYNLNSTFGLASPSLEVPNTGVSTTSQMDRYLKMGALSNGMFIVVYEQVYTSANGVYYFVYDDQLNPICPKTLIHSNGRFPDVAIYKDIAYIAYYDQPNQVVLGREIDPITCSIQTNYTIHTGSALHKSLAIGVSSDTDSVQSAVIVVQFITNSGPTQDLVIYEYLIEQIDISNNLIQCPQEGCTGCYGSYTCPICIGSDDIQKQLRQIGPNNCSCPNTFFSDLSINIDCQPCQFPCADCLSTTQCTTCQTTDPNQDSNCKCNIGFSRLNTDTICSQCHHSCDSCVGDINTCGGCSHNTRSMPSCNCNPGYFNNGTEKACAQCVYPCDLCSAEFTCNSCQNPANRISPTNCNCQQNYYETGSQCEKCHRTCLSCSGNSTNCTERCHRKCISCIGTYDNCVEYCDPQCYSCDKLGKCTHCVLGQFLDQQQNCINCHKKCLNCAQNSENCLQCAKGSNRTMDQPTNCGCVDGYYDIGLLDCVKCPTQNCLKCDQQGKCLQCVLNYLDPNQDCKSLLISKNMNHNPDCNIKCLSCNNDKDDCTQCSKGLYRDIKSECNCIEGYHDQNGVKIDCEKCHYSCKQCSDFQECTECEEGRNLNQFNFQCECLKGYQENKLTKLCERCYFYSGNCFQQCPQNTVPDNQSFVCVVNEYSIKQNKLLNWICGITILIISSLWVASSNIHQNPGSWKFFQFYSEQTEIAYTRDNVTIALQETLKQNQLPQNFTVIASQYQIVNGVNIKLIFKIEEYGIYSAFIYTIPYANFTEVQKFKNLINFQIMEEQPDENQYGNYREFDWESDSLSDRILRSVVSYSVEQKLQEQGLSTNFEVFGSWYQVVSGINIELIILSDDHMYNTVVYIQPWTLTNRVVKFEEIVVYEKNVNNTKTQNKIRSGKFLPN